MAAKLPFCHSGRSLAAVIKRLAPADGVCRRCRGGGYLLFHFRSIIGVARFNFSVRNGKRWSPCAIATLVSCFPSGGLRPGGRPSPDCPPLPPLGVVRLSEPLCRSKTRLEAVARSISDRVSLWTSLLCLSWRAACLPAGASAAVFEPLAASAEWLDSERVWVISIARL